MATYQTHHQGNIVELAIKKSLLTIVDVARELGVNRRTVYNYLGKETLPQDLIERFGKILGVDFYTEYPSVFTKYDKLPGTVMKLHNEDDQPQQPQQPVEAASGDIKDKLIASLERERIQLMTEKLNLQQEVFELKQKLAAIESAK